jgi:chorismate-pyruvate lyase
MTPTADAKTADLLYPLSFFRERDGRPAPAIEIIDGAHVPEPYKALLVHQGDMTSRLEAFHASPMKLRVLNVERTSSTYRREVLLCARDSGLPVEYGAIEINLDGFAEPLRSEVLEGRLPLGGLLNRAAFRYRSEPRGYLRIFPDPTLCRLFGIDAAPALYGRSNTLLGEDNVVLATIVEVLRP